MSGSSSKTVSFLLLLLANARGEAAAAAATATDGNVTLSSPRERRVHMSYANYHRIKVPIHARLLDAMKDSGHPRHRGKTRHYEIETLDESSSISSLSVHEVSSMAVTAQTTYNFKNRELGMDSLNHFSILAHHAKDVMTILSVDKSSGRVRGLHRELGGKSRHVTNEDGGKLHIRSLEEVNNRKEWTCDAMRHEHNEKRSADLNSTSSAVAISSRNTDLRKRGSRNDGKLDDKNII